MDSTAQRQTFQLLASVGAALLLFSIIFNLYLVWRNVSLYRESERRAVRIQRIENDVREWQAFFAELLEFSKAHPSVNPIVQKYLAQPPGPAPKSR